MIVDNFDWEMLYEKADSFMKSISAREYIIATNTKSSFGNEPVVTVSFPKRVNTSAIMRLDKNNACIKRRGYKKDNKLFCTYGIYINRLD